MSPMLGYAGDGCLAGGGGLPTGASACAYATPASAEELCICRHTCVPVDVTTLFLPSPSACTTYLGELRRA